MTSAGTPEPRGEKNELIFFGGGGKQAERMSAGSLGWLENNIPCGKEKNSAQR